jgi:hypothetical protein
MTEQQEFELVAKAAGIELVRDPNGILRDCTGSMNIFACPVWNPKEDDGDSRRLQVALGIMLAVDQDYAHATRADLPKWFAESIGKDPNAATRMAVWKAALEIAKGMKC